MSIVKVYGADWCHDTQAVRNNLDSLGVQYEYVNVDIDPSASDWVKQHNAGKTKLPTVDIVGKVLSVPDERDLEKALRGTGLMS